MLAAKADAAHVNSNCGSLHMSKYKEDGKELS